MGRLKLLYLCDSLGDGRAGGLVAARRLIGALAPEVDVLTLGVGGEVPMRALELPFIGGLVRKNGFAFARPDDAALLRALAWADVAHLQLPTWLSFRALRLARRTGTPVLAAHHVQPENVLPYLRLDSPALARWLNRLLVTHFLQRTDLVVCPTAFARGELLAAGLTTRAEVVSNGLPARFVPALALHAPAPLFRIVSVGRHSVEKKQGVLIEAVLRMRHRDEVSLLLGGRGPRTQALQRQAAPLGGRAQVGFLEDAALLSAYQQADLVVHPSEVELEGLAVAEALACGTPVMVSGARSNAAVEFAHDARFIFRASDAVDLAARLDFWVEHRAELEALRAPAAARGATLKLAQSAAAMAGLYRELSQARARTGPRLALRPVPVRPVASPRPTV